MSRSRKISEADMLHAVRKGGDIRLFLLYGREETLAEEIARRLSAAVGDGAERVDIDATTATLEPAALVDEAASISLFGAPRYVRLRLSADRALDALTGLLDATATGNPVIAIAGNLTKGNKTRKLAESHPRAMAFACYPQSDDEARAYVERLARQKGLRLDERIARRIVSLTSGDRMLAELELEKLALYLDAGPETAGEIEVPHEAVEALGAEALEENLDDLFASVLSGKLKAFGTELATARQMAIDPIRTVKALQIRVGKLISLSAATRPGDRPRAVVERDRSIHFRSAEAYASELEIWNPVRLARLNERLVSLETRMMSGAANSATILGQELTEIARVAQRMR